MRDCPRDHMLNRSQHTGLNMFVMGRAMERSLVDHFPCDREIEAVLVTFYFGRNQLNFFKN